MEIDQIQAIDNHAHPVCPVAQGEQPDKDYDALPVEQLEPSFDPIRLRPGALDLAEAHRSLGQDRASVTKVLDRAGIGIMLANRVAMGAGLPAARFLWVAYADALMYPLDNTSLATNSDRKAFFGLEEQLLARYYRESGVAGRPSTLDDYLENVVEATVDRHKQGGAVAEKFEMAYLRSLAVGNPSKAEAEAAWAGKSEYRLLQDYIFRFIALECGRLGMAVHIHTGAGAGGYFDVAGSNPILLEPLFNDPALRHTNFVMLHGGWPFSGLVAPLLAKPNAWVDFSVQALILSRDELAGNLRSWLEFVPEKIMFGTDAYPYSQDAGWQETAVASARAGRAALKLALTQMMRENEITADRAVELARMVLRDNARKLYNLP
jgi:predicted TIM-barrel fold metal-dependent hydrolase